MVGRQYGGDRVLIVLTALSFVLGTVPYFLGTYLLYLVLYLLYLVLYLPVLGVVYSIVSTGIIWEQCGIVQSISTGWQWDFLAFVADTIYTERYMGLASPSDNYRGYDVSVSMSRIWKSVLLSWRVSIICTLSCFQTANVIHKVQHFKGKDFLLVHGTADGELSPALCQEYCLCEFIGQSGVWLHVQMSGLFSQVK